MILYEQEEICEQRGLAKTEIAGDDGRGDCVGAWTCGFDRIDSQNRKSPRCGEANGGIVYASVETDQIYESAFQRAYSRGGPGREDWRRGEAHKRRAADTRDVSTDGKRMPSRDGIELAANAAVIEVI